MILRVRPLRFEFRARDAISFAPGQTANTFRGAFGEIFRRIACSEDCPGAKTCRRASECAYARMFEPRAPRDAAGPSGFRDLPRPFVLRAASLDGRTFLAGEQFEIGINLFDPGVPALDYFSQAFSELCVRGLGPGRPRVELLRATELPAALLDFGMARPPTPRVRLTFLTPTELKSGGESLREPHFDAVIRRSRDRVTGLVGLYQGGFRAESIDFRGLGDRASLVRMTSSRLDQCDYQRRSSRTGQSHSLGGFRGEAEYEGDIAEFLPWLEALWWTGVGRLTVWGNGWVQTEVG